MHAPAPGVHDLFWDTSALYFLVRCRIYTLKPVCQAFLLCLLLSVLIPGAFFPVLPPTVLIPRSGFSLTKSSPLPKLSTTFCPCPLLLHPAAPKKHQRALFGHANLGTSPVIILKGLRDVLNSLSMFPHGTVLPLEAIW